jgi:hypothetical protein
VYFGQGKIVVGKTVWKALARIMGRHGRYTGGDGVLGLRRVDLVTGPHGLHKTRRRFVTISATAPCSRSAVLRTLHRRHPVSLDLLTSQTEPLNPPAVRRSRCPWYGHFTLCPSTLRYCDAISLNFPTTAAYVLLGSGCERM